MTPKSVIFLVIYILLFCSQTYAQRRGDVAIGKVNLYVVLMLHPAMINYDTEVNAFVVQRDAVSEQKAKNEEAINKEKVSNVEKQIRQFRANVREEDKRFMNKINSLTKKHNEELEVLATGPAAISEIKFKQKKDKEEIAYFSKISSINAEINRLEEELKKLTDYDFKKGFTTPEETYKKFDSIIAETQSYIKRIAEQKGISIVLNSKYNRMMLRKENGEIKNLPNSINLNAIFNTPVQGTLNKDSYALKGFYESIDYRTISWLNNGGHILNRFNLNLIDSDIILGGVDLTGDVLNALYKAYKLEPNVSNAVIKSAISY